MKCVTRRYRYNTYGSFALVLCTIVLGSFGDLAIFVSEDKLSKCCFVYIYDSITTTILNVIPVTVYTGVTSWDLEV